MSKQDNLATRRSIWRRPATWIALLLLCFVAAISLVGLRELKAKMDIQQQIADLRTKGLPVDDESMEAYFIANTSNENSAAWSEVRSELSNAWISTLGADLPEVGQGVLPVSALSGGDWPNEPIVAEYLTKVQPTIAKLHALAHTKGPVWQPIHFDGFGTLLGPLQESRSLTRTLALDFDHALYSKDRQRALDDLRAMGAVAEAFRWENFIVADLVHIALVSQTRSMIQRSMQVDLWTVEDLAALRDLVGEARDISQVWPKMMASERAMALSMIQSGNFRGILDNSRFMELLLSLPTVQRGYLENVDRLLAVGAGGIDELELRAERAELATYASQNVLSQAVLPATQALAQAYVRSENTRRITLLALAAKQFKLDNQRLPKSLVELQQASSLGISSRELQAVDKQAFGYSLEDQTAYIWSTRESTDIHSRIQSTRPDNFDPLDGAVERVTGEVVTIR